MNRILKPNGSKITRDFKNNRHTITNRNIKVENPPSKNYILHHQSVRNGSKSVEAIKFKMKEIVKSSGNHLFKKKNFLTRGTILKTSSIMLNGVEHSIEIDLLQISKPDAKLLTAKCLTLKDAATLEELIHKQIK